MVGALADWFAVTALFRRPLGLPIPHTAIIPTKKDQLGVSLGEFVGENFLSQDVVRQRLRAVGIGSRLGAWLAEPEHADRVTAELATALRGALTVLRDSDVQAVVGEAITRRADRPGDRARHRQDAGEGRRRRRPQTGRRPDLRPRPRLAGPPRRAGHGRGPGRRPRLDPAVRRQEGRRARLQGTAPLRHRDARHRPPTRPAAPSTASSPTSPPTSSRTRRPAGGWRGSRARCWAGARYRTSSPPRGPPYDP